MHKAAVVVDLFAGDSGKGSVTEFLVRELGADLVVRFNGANQAAHHVVLEDGTWHAFSSFGSGTFAGARTYLSKYMLIDPMALVREAKVLESKGVSDPLSLVTIDYDCLIITPWQKLANRLRERARGAARHGSVGLGVGEARGDWLNHQRGFHVRSLREGISPQGLRAMREYKLETLRPLRSADPEIYAQMEAISVADVRDSFRCLDTVNVRGFGYMAQRSKCAVFEGAQGVLLDETHGFAPYNTWTDCTFNNANTLLEEAGCEDVQRIGVLRTYATRHGNGPLPTEASLDVDEPHNATHPWMGPFRVGHFDGALANYALNCCKRQLDGLALTHLDRIPSGKICTGYQEPTDIAKGIFGKPLYIEADPRPEAFIPIVEALLDTPVLIQSYGPKASDKMFATACRTA